MATIPTDLTDLQVQELVRELSKSGSIKLAADTTGVDRSAVHRRRSHDRAFRASMDRARIRGHMRKMREVSDELMFAIDALNRLLDCGDPVDELVNCLYQYTPPPGASRAGVTSRELEAARDRLRKAGYAWAREVSIHSQLAGNGGLS